MSSQYQAEVISIGTEILRGETIDTNAGYLASQLPFLGIELYRITAAADNQEQICQVLRQALERSTLVLTTGGLGPTEDDLTRECIASVLGEQLTVNTELERQLRTFFDRLGRGMPNHNIKQVMLIPSAEPVPNPYGTAPGWWVEKNGKFIIALPGPPRELKPMWQNEIKPRLQTRFPGQKILSRTLKTVGLAEATVAEMALPLFSSINPSLGIYARPDGNHLRLIACGENAEELLETAEEQLRVIFTDRIWGEDEDKLEEVLGQWLNEEGLTLATMEDGTGGLLANSLTNTASSGYYRGGLVTCSDEMKIVWGVPGRLIEQYGATSTEVAEAMASIARQRFSADFGLSITHIAGLGSTDARSAALVYISLADAQGKRSLRQTYPPQRERSRARAAMAALFFLRQRLVEFKIAHA